jgi:predicted HicB family RNase H-like nuclease
MEIRCKRIIEGKTYNTETATQITGSIREEGPGEITEYLYHNRFGAFFLYQNVDGWEEQDGEKLIPRTPEQAREWLEKQPNGAHHIEALFGVMPEAGSGEIKFTLRIPESLRDRLAALAKENNQSLNAWMVRCLESCSAPKTNASKRRVSL